MRSKDSLIQSKITAEHSNVHSSSRSEHCPLIRRERDADRDSLPEQQLREGTRTPGKRERPGHRTWAFTVELLTTYSHSIQAADLHFAFWRPHGTDGQRSNRPPRHRGAFANDSPTT